MTYDEIFDSKDINSAKKVILTPTPEKSTEDRWSKEVPLMYSALEKSLKNSLIVCDFGMGIGRIARKFLEEEDSINIIGIDSSKQMLKLCEEYIPKEYQPRLELRVDLDLIPNSHIDFAYAVFVLQHVHKEDFEPAVRNLNRVLKPNGRLYLLNTKNRYVYDSKTHQYIDDGLDQYEMISKYFDQIGTIDFDSKYMDNILKTHVSLLYKPTLKMK